MNVKAYFREFGMSLLAQFIMKGQFRAILLAGILGGFSQRFPPLAIFSSVIVSMYIMRKGEAEGLVVLIGTAAITFVMSFYIESRLGLDFPVALGLLIPVYLCSRVLRATESQGYAITAAAACSAVFAFSVQLITGDAILWWSGWLETVVENVRGATYEGFEEDGTIMVMNGLVAILLGLSTISSILIARWMQSILYNPGGFKAEFQLIQIPRLFLYGLIVLILVFAALQSSLMGDLLIIGAMMYFFQGLATLHYNVNKQKRSSAFLLPPYLLLFMVPQFVVIGLACVGVSDTFLNYRKLPKMM